MVNQRRDTRRRSGAAQKSWLKEQMARRPLPIWMLAVIDMLVFAVALLGFAYFHHVMPRAQEGLGLESNRSGIAAAVNVVEENAAPASVQTAETAVDTAPAATPEPAAEKVGYFGDKFADKFTGGEVISTAESYQSGSVNIAMQRHTVQGISFYVADIYIKDIECFKTALANDQFGRGYSEMPEVIDKRLGSILTINGDYYGMSEEGVVLRNGVLYRDCDFPMTDVGVLYWDGSMETYPSMPFDSAAELAKGAYQVWCFGPRLLDETGARMENFNSAVEKSNPRTAIGYFEPGHYCFVVVDGRSDESAGMTMAQLSALMENLGCVRAYNLDGGRTSMMVWNDEVINAAYRDGRECSDVVMIMDL